MEPYYIKRHPDLDLSSLLMVLSLTCYKVSTRFAVKEAGILRILAQWIQQIWQFILSVYLRNQP